MQTKKAKLLTAILALLTIALSATQVNAINGNCQIDNTHSFVGLVVFYEEDANGNQIPVSLSSGILLSPTVMLTTAHSCQTSQVIVCFDQGPITWSIKDGQIQINGVTSTYQGIAYPHPNFTISQTSNGGMAEFMHNDLAIIILNNPVPTSVADTYAQLPTIGIVDTLKAKTDVTLVGYGLPTRSTPVAITRNCAYSQIVSGNFAWSDEYLRCTANPGHGKGGISNGDSGGPVLLGQTNTVIALNSYTTNHNCAGVSYHVRLDLPEVLDWIVEVTALE